MINWMFRYFLIYSISSSELYYQGQYIHFFRLSEKNIKRHILYYNSDHTYGKVMLQEGNNVVRKIYYPTIDLVSTCWAPSFGVNYKFAQAQGHRCYTF